MTKRNEHFLWAGVHNVLVHPLMWMLRYPRWTLAVHDWTARRAWRAGHAFEVVSDGYERPDR